MVGTMEDLYSILGVSRSASAAEIGKAYRRLARKYHPDLNPGRADAEEKFKRASAAYEVLSNPDKRAVYDEFGEQSLKSGFDPEQARAYRQWHGSRADARQPFTMDGSGLDGVDFAGAGFDLGALFQDMFGQGGFRSEPHEVHAEVELDLAQAIQGAEVTLELPYSEPCASCRGTGRATQTSGRAAKACSACSGRGTRRARRQVAVRVPPGADDGSTLRVPASEVFGSAEVTGGDIVIQTRVRPHPWFRREGLDLHVKVPVSLEEAYNGARIEIPTFSGSVKLRIPPGSQPGARLRLRGKGVARGSQHGDLYVELDVRLPPGHDPMLAQALAGTGSQYARSLRESVRL
jgi:DnaJ-class molecular chaperone